MGLFSKQRKELDFEDIVSVVILEQTQLYKNKSNWGISFGSTFGDGHVIAMDGSIPAGSEIKFSVTYKNGKKEIVKAMSGTDVCDRLLQLAVDPSSLQFQDTIDKPAKEYSPVSVEKNELPAGQYIIGKDIPEGTYDFTWVWGNGSISKYKNDHDTTLGASTYFQWMGNTQEYEFRQCINVKCVDGEMLDLGGNMIVRISKSKPIELDL